MATDPTTETAPPGLASSAVRRTGRLSGRAVVGVLAAACLLFLVGAASMAGVALNWPDAIKTAGVLAFIAAMVALAFGMIGRDLRA